MTWTATVLRAGNFRLDGGSMFGVVPKAIWSRLVEPDDGNRIPLQTNCLLLEDGKHLVLVEAGYGDGWDEKSTQNFDLESRTVTDALTELGVEPTSITHTIVTHLHFDHCGGLTHTNTQGQDVRAFPNAKCIVQEREWKDAQSNKSTMSKTYLTKNLAPLEEDLELVDGQKEVLPGLFVWPTPGHTWGHQSVRAQTKDGTVAFLGDVVPTFNHVPLPFSMGYDMLPWDNMQTKQTVLTQAMDEDWRIVLAHEPGNPQVRAIADPRGHGRFAFEPL